MSSIEVLVYLGLYSLLFGCLLGENWKQIKNAPPKPDYVEYETPADAASRWFDEKRVGTCNRCNHNDAPIVYGYSCKWCYELENIKTHLITTGSRKS